ncbi:MAG: HEAT repeat domain-containing protein, partial [Pirellulaceae bacterium]|nr:HEAT repeat domain-containing protein [Pirellulaceae bacterium]
KALSVNGRGVVLDPRTKTFETTSGGGQNGMGVDDWGFKYLCSNVNPIQLLMYDTRYAKRNPYFAPRNPAVNINAAEGAKLHRISPLEPWRVVRSKRVADARGDDDEGAHPGGRFTSASGVTIYRGDAWPKEYRGDLFVGEVANNLVYRARLSYDGLGVTALRADEEREFLASTDTWFRPVQFANAPDGNLYVVDMYRELIEGAAFVPPELLANLDPRNGSDRGRIYRIRATGEANAEPAATTRRLPKRADVAALAQLLDHENGWHRDTASRLLSEVGDVAAARDLKRIARESQRPQGRIHALYALQELDRLSEAMLLSGLRDESPFVRLHAIRLCESANRDSVELRGQLHSMVADPNERVRFQLAQTLGEFPGVRTQESLAKLLDQDGGDPWMRDAVQSSLRDSAGAVLLQLASSPDFHRRPFAAEVLSGLAKQIGSQNRRSDIALLAGAVQAISVKDIELQRRVLQVALLNATPAVRRQLADDEQWAAETKELIEAAPAAALDAQRDLAARIDAARLLAVVDLDDEGVLDALRRLLHWRQAKSLQSAVIEALGRHRDRERTPQLLLAAWPTLSPALRMQAAEVLFSRTSWTIAVLDAIDRDAIDETEISASRVASLLNHENAGVRSRARRLSESASQVDRQVVLQRYSSAIGRRGDIDRGKNVFKNNCSACHQLVDARGLQISAGPLLAGIGDKRQSVVLTHILDPNREVSPKYLNFVVAMDDGRSVAGMIVSETSNGLQLQRADGQRIDILRLRVESMKSTGVSFMPEGLEKQISVPGMADLLAYLSTIR